jgi:hypothetical protein
VTKPVPPFDSGESATGRFNGAYSGATRQRPLARENLFNPVNENYKRGD